MRLLSILPIARGIRTEMLTYFSTKDLPLGTLVTVPLRKKEILGIVIESDDALKSKSSIKGMDFSVRKIIEAKDGASLPSWLIEAAQKVAVTSATSVGAVIAGLIPKLCIENPELFYIHKAEKKEGEKQFEILGIQSGESERFDTYRSIIRESFAKKKSIAIICPTEENVHTAFELLSKGINDYTLPLTSTTSKKHMTAWQERAHNQSHPVLLIGTYTMLSLLPSHIGTLIIEEESSPFYKSRRRPYLDMRIVATEIARSLDARLLYGDKLLSVETLAYIKEGRINEYSRISKRNPHKIQTLLVDMKPAAEEIPVKEVDRNYRPVKKEFVVISPDLREMIRYAMHGGKKVFVYAARRGVAPQTVCRDCGITVMCAECESPVVLHAKNNQAPMPEGQSDPYRKFICHHCGISRSANEVCKSCNGWNLIPLGIGIERVEEEIRKITDAEIIRIDSDSCKTAKDVRLKIDRFLMKDDEGKIGKILVGTDLALRFLPVESVDFAAIASLDSLFSLPDFRIGERVMHTILDVKAKATECLLLQARNIKEKIIEYGLAGDLESFAKDQIKARKDFGYPPFMNLIKLTVSGKKEKVKEDAANVAIKLKELKPVVFPAFIKSVKGETSLHILVKIPEKEWPDKSIEDILLSFPPSVKIDTSPQSLL